MLATGRSNASSQGPRGYDLSGSSHCRRQHLVATKLREERGRQLQRAASATILGHAPGTSYGQGYIQQEAFFTGTSTPSKLAPHLRGPSGASNASSPASRRSTGQLQLGKSSSAPFEAATHAGTSPVFAAEPEPAGRLLLDVLIDGIRARFRQKGVLEVNDVRGEFAKICRGGKSLKKDEFIWALSKHDICRDPREAEAIFDYIDANGSNSIEYEEFLYLVQGSLNPRRKMVVRQAFDYIDKNGNGVLEIDDLTKAWNASSSAEVMCGVKSKEEMMKEFISVFDVINPDGKVTLSEFEQYYETVSSLVQSDAMFEAMVRNAWRLDEAEGGHCLRLRVTQANGHAKVVEIREGSQELDRHSPRFPQRVRRILKQRGIVDVEYFEICGRY